MPDSGEFVTERSAQCDTCWTRRSCETEGFKECTGYRFEPRCSEHPDKALVRGPDHLGQGLRVCPECGKWVCADCGASGHKGQFQVVDWMTGLCSDCYDRRDAVKYRRAQRVARAEEAYARAADSVLSADSDWSLAVGLADLSAKRNTLKQVRGW